MKFNAILMAATVAAGLMLSANPLAAAENNAQTPIQVKVAVIDMDLIVQKAKARADIDAQLEESRQKVLAEAQKEEEKLREANSELARQRSILTPEAYEEKRNEFNTQMVDAQRRLQAQRLAIAKAEKQAMLDFQQVLTKVISAVSQKNGITLLLRRKGVVLMAEQFDVTKMVLDGMDEKLPKVPVTVQWPAETGK